MEKSGDLVRQKRTEEKEEGGLGRVGVEGGTATEAGTQKTVNQKVQECTETGGKSRPAGSGLPRKSGQGRGWGCALH